MFKKIGDNSLVKELTKSYNKKSFPKKFILKFIALALLLFSIANLRTKTGTQNVNRKGIDVMIALDVSKSMLAEDVKPNRLERAKNLLAKLIDKLDNDRIGIVVFAGKAYIQMPLTADHSAAKMYLSAATPQTIPTQGTVISDALNMCNTAFNNNEKKYKSVILISDGEDHDENALKISEKMANEGVVINTIGIGSVEGSIILDEFTKQEKKDNNGNTIITKLNEKILADIAEKGNGNYLLFSNTNTVVTNLYNTLSSLDSKTVKDESLVNYKSWFQYLLGLAFLFLLVELFISEINKKAIQKTTLSASVILLFFCMPTFAQNVNGIIKKGNNAYLKNDFETAIKNYNEAVQTNKDNSIAQFNLGNALYKTDKKDEAVEAFERATLAVKTPSEKSNAQYNKAVVLQSNKKLDESIVAYKEALKNNPNNDDARYNLQLALKQQKQQEQNKKKEEKDNKKDKEQKDKKNDKKKNDEEDQQPKPNKSNISQKDAEQELEALLQKEKDLQDKMHKANITNPNKQEKDW
ncbi:MAG: VWA domain-containing protein [Ferruginibacter sp.]|nr:VWA domain-containing protein [Ferruginibacter sp.]